MRTQGIVCAAAMGVAILAVNGGPCLGDVMDIVTLERRVNAYIYPTRDEATSDAIGLWTKDVDVLDGQLYAAAEQSSNVSSGQIEGTGKVRLLAFQAGYPMLVASSEMNVIFLLPGSQSFQISGYLDKNHGGGNLKVTLSSTQADVFAATGDTDFDEIITLSQGSYQLVAYGYDSASPTSSFDRQMEWVVSFTPVPEPSTMTLLAFLTLGIGRRAGRCCIRFRTPG